MATNTAYTAAQSFAQDARQKACGYITYPATSIVAADSTVIACGFKPRYVQWCDVTSRIQIEWFEGMAANTCLKTAVDGVKTIETTNGGITVSNSGFSVLQNATLAAILASEVVAWRANG